MRMGSGVDTEAAMVFALAAAALVGATGCGTESASDAAEELALAEAARPSYSIRLDSPSSDLAEYRVVEDDDGVRVQTGPAGIVYREDDVVRVGDFTAAASLQLFDASVGYREAYGIFVGGLDLQGPDQEYTYLLIRPTGEFLIKRRLGEITETLVDWTPHDAVRGVVTAGDEPSNVLAVDVRGQETSFLVNGDVVHTAPTSRVRPYGIAGVRVNHRLDVRVDDWALAEDSQQ